jgi:hypothetical protein
MTQNGSAPATETPPTFWARLRKRALCGKIGLAASLVAPSAGAPVTTRSTCGKIGLAASLVAWACLLAIVVVPHG